MEQRHVAAIAALERACFSDPWTDAAIASELDNPLSLWLVAISDDTVCGYIGSQTCGEESDMMNLAVAPAYRRQGVAEQLVSALARELRKQGSRSLTLEVRESNAPARELYQKLGFVQTGRRPNYYFHPQEAALILRKELVECENFSH